MQATEQELAQARAEGAQREMSIRAAKEDGAREAASIAEERTRLFERIADLDKRYSNLAYPQSTPDAFGKMAAEKQYVEETRGIGR